MKETELSAPDMDVLLSDGESTCLGAFWRQGPVALVFLRHLGCPFARQQVARLRREQDGLKTAGIHVVLLGCATPAQAESFRHEFDVPFPIVCDPDCVLYQKYGLKQMRTSDFFSPVMAWKVVKVLAQGYGHRSGQGPERQLGGVFIIDQRGTIRFTHVAADAADNPSPAAIIRAAVRLNGQLVAGRS